MDWMYLDKLTTVYLVIWIECVQTNYLLSIQLYGLNVSRQIHYCLSSYMDWMCLDKLTTVYLVIQIGCVQTNSMRLVYEYAQLYCVYRYGIECAYLCLSLKFARYKMHYGFLNSWNIYVQKFIQMRLIFSNGFEILVNSVVFQTSSVLRKPILVQTPFNVAKFCFYN